MKATQCFLVIVSVVCAIVTLHLSPAQAINYPKSPATTRDSAPASATPAPAAASVKIENFSFLREELNIAAGTTVTWQGDETGTEMKRGRS